MQPAIESPRDSAMWKHLFGAASSSLLGVAITTLSQIEITVRIIGAVVAVLTGIVWLIHALRVLKKDRNNGG